MASVFDVAAYILRQQGPMTAMKLQKLVYYSQAWSLAWDDDRMFPEEIQAWANGPVVPALFREHQGKFRVNAGTFAKGNPDRLTEVQETTINVVLEFYGDKSPQWLSDLTHMESPWQEARSGLPAEARSGAVISLESMAEYYSSLS
jgi:uncharacterized phage-associated protein